MAGMGGCTKNVFTTTNGCHCFTEAMLQCLPFGRNWGRDSIPVWMMAEGRGVGVFLPLLIRGV